MPQNFSGRLPIALTLLASMLAACHGGGGSYLPAQSSNNTPSTQAQQLVTQLSASLPSTINIYFGLVQGVDNRFSPVDGDDTSTGGGVGQLITTVDGKRQLNCGVMAQNLYHIHFYLGILMNGVQYATPDAIGILGAPTSDPSGQINSGKCFYSIHTHDASGMVHIETNFSAAYSAPIFHLGDFLKVWGKTISSTSFAGLNGPITIFTAPPKGTVPGTNDFQLTGNYTKYSGDPHFLPLTTHETIWVEVGTVVGSTQLPKVHFYPAH